MEFEFLPELLYEQYEYSSFTWVVFLLLLISCLSKSNKFFLGSSKQKKAFQSGNYYCIIYTYPRTQYWVPNI